MTYNTHKDKPTLGKSPLTLCHELGVWHGLCGLCSNESHTTQHYRRNSTRPHYALWSVGGEEGCNIMDSSVYTSGQSSKGCHTYTQAILPTPQPHPHPHRREEKERNIEERREEAEEEESIRERKRENREEEERRIEKRRWENRVCWYVRCGVADNHW